MAKGLFGEYFHIPAIAANAWTGHPGGVTYEMFENKSTDFAGAMNDYVSATYDDFGEDEWIWEEDEDAVDKAIFQLKKGPTAPGSFMTPYGPALANESIMEVVQEYPGAAELTGDVQEMFAAAEDFIEDGGEDFDDFVYELEEFAEESGNDLWSIISGAGSAIADAVGNVVSGIQDWMEPYTTYGADGEPDVTPEPEPKDEGDSLWDKFMNVLTVTETAPLAGGTAIVEAGVDWLGTQTANYFETVGDTAKFKNAADSAALDFVFGDAISPETGAKFAKIEDDKYYQDSIKELELQLDNEGLPAMLAFIEAELGGAVDQDVVEDWVDILRQRGTDYSLAVADDIAATLARMAVLVGPVGQEPPAPAEAAVGPGTETTPTAPVEGGILSQAEQHLADYDEAIRLNPQDANAYNNRGIAYGYLGQYEQAIQDYDEAIRLNPQHAWAYYNRGLAYSSLGQYEQAIQDYDEAILLNPQYAIMTEHYRDAAIAKLEEQDATAEQDIDTGGVGITTAEQDLDILPEDDEGFDDVLLGDKDDEGDDLPVDPLDPDAPTVDYKTQFDLYFSGLRGSASYEAQQRKDALFRDAEMLFYLDTDWNDRDWLDFPITPVTGIMPWEMHGDDDVKKEEAFFSNWLNETYATQTRAERYGPDFYKSVQDLRDNMYALRDITEDEFNEMIGTGEISYDRATDRSAFMRGDAYSNDRLGSLVAAYNIHPGADVWMQQELRSMYKNALAHWITSGREPVDFMQTFVKDQPEMVGGSQGSQAGYTATYPHKEA